MFGFLELLDASTWIERLTSALSTIDLMRDVLNVNIPSRCVRMIGEDICGALWDRMSQDPEVWYASHLSTLRTAYRDRSDVAYSISQAMHWGPSVFSESSA
jgi:hypothetical protein